MWGEGREDGGSGLGTFAPWSSSGRNLNGFRYKISVLPVGGEWSISNANVYEGFGCYGFTKRDGTNNTRGFRFANLYLLEAVGLIMALLKEGWDRFMSLSTEQLLV